MKLRVCFVIPTLERGGAEKQLSLLAAGLDREEFEPIVITLTRSGPHEQELVAAGVRVEHIGKKAKFDPFAWLRLRKRLLELKPDIVHTWLFAANAYGRSAALSAKVPVILGSERCVDPWKRSYEFWIDRWLAKRTAGITVNSRGTSDFYAAHGIASEQIQLIPNAIEPAAMQTLSREQACANFGIDPRLHIVLSIGRLWRQKGYKDLIWSAELLRVQRSDVCYVIIGDGPERDRLEAFRDNVKVAGHVHLVGHRDDAAQLLPHCDVFWNGSLYEGQSNGILEAMQAGVPVIASKIPGNVDLIEHDQTGLLFSLGNVDELARWTNELLHDPERRNRMARNAKERIEREHRLETMIGRHQVYFRAKADARKNGSGV